MKNLLSLVFLISLFQSCQKAPSPPNIVVLYTDDQRFNTINAWGNEEIHTPNMDKLAEMGVSFTRTYVMGSHHGAVCAPSRAMLLSGRPYFNIPKEYIDRGHLPNEHNFDFTTFPEMFRQQGYATFFTGKWHNHTSKLRQGFESGKNIFIGGMHWPKAGGHVNPQLWDYDETGKYSNENRWKGENFSSQMYSDAAVEFIENSKDKKPFCLYVAYTSPHDPREAPAEFLELYDTSKITLPANFFPQHPFDNGHLRIRDELLAPFPRTPGIVKQEIAGYYAMVSEVDAQIGRVVDALESSGQLDNTIIVFAGDNGLAVGQHGLLGKQNLYEHSARVPLIIAAPGIEGNRKANTLCYLYDIFPTLCDLTGTEIPASVQGKSLLPAIQNEAAIIRTNIALAHAQQQRAIRTDDDWKLIRYFVKGVNHTQLYNLKEDPWEVVNLADRPEFAEKQKELENMLSSQILASNDNFLQPSISLKHEGFGQPVKVSINKPFPELELRYSLDGTAPNQESILYETPFSCAERTIVKAQIFIKNRAIGDLIEEEASPSKNIKTAILTTPPAKRYKGNDVFTLFDNQSGDVDFKNEKWLGFRAKDFEIIIDLGESQTLNEIGIGYLINHGSWIFAPTEVEASFSIDGQHFVPLFKESMEESTNQKESVVSSYIKKISPVNANFLKLKVSNIGKCPDWHTGAGEPAWLFVDEVIFE